MYDFHTLSPLDFEELVRDLLEAELGIALESFGPAADLGIDFRFSSADGNIIVQAKHYAKSGPKALVQAARGENEKIKQLNPSRYIWATSVSMTPALKERLKKALPAAPLSDGDVLGREDLNKILRKHDAIERKHFKLWLSSTAVLDRIVRSGVYNRTRAEMASIRSMLPKFVYNDSIPKAEAILKEQGALIISGEPGVGKSTLARMLTWLHAEQGWKVAVIDDIKDAFEVANEGERKVIFFDDFLGQIRLSRDVIYAMDQRLPPFLRQVRTSNDIRFILTTRDYLLRQAQDESDRLSSAEFNASEFILNVGQYTRSVRAQILYNHLYFARLTQDQRDELLAGDFYLEVIDHKNFNPRLIELLTSREIIGLEHQPLRQIVRTTLENPDSLWDKPYQVHISDGARALVLGMFFNADETPLDVLERSFGRVMRATEARVSQASIVRRFRAALKEVEGSFIAIQNQRAKFSNPGVRDFMQRTVLADRLIAPVLEELTEYQELLQAWLLSSGSLSAEVLWDLRIQWASAVVRLGKNTSGTHLQRLSLMLEIYDAIRVDEIVPTILEQVTLTIASKWKTNDFADLRLAIMHIGKSKLPAAVLETVRTNLGKATLRFLSSRGGMLAIENLEWLITNLDKLDVEDEQATAVAKVALGEFVDLLDGDLENLEEESELDSLEDRLLWLLSEYGLNDTDAVSAIDDRRYAIEEKSNEDEDDGYSPTRRPANKSNSDNSIRSMFRSLRERK